MRYWRKTSRNRSKELTVPLRDAPLIPYGGLQAERLFTEDDFINGELKPGIPKPELGTEVRPGDIKYVDMNDDGVITEADEGYIGGTKRSAYGIRFRW